MSIKLAAFDLDGTLLGKNGHIHPVNVRALRACQEQGVRLMICSGRAFEVQAGFAMEAGMDFILASANGARIDEGIDGPTLLELPIERDMAGKIFEILYHSGMYCMIFSRAHAYAINTHERDRLGHHVHPAGKAVLHGRYPYEVVEDLDRVREEAVQAPYKFVCLGQDYDPRFDEIRGALREAGFDMSISSSWRNNMEIMRPGVDKGSAVRFVAERLGIAMDEVMAFGDNSNDLPMLETVGWPVAMGNSEPCALRAARVVAQDHDVGGVGLALNEYVLGK